MQKTLIGTQDRQKSFPKDHLNAIFDAFTNESSQGLSEYQFHDTLEAQDCDLFLALDSDDTGASQINIHLQHLQLNAQLEVLMSLANFAALDDSCNPEDPLKYLDAQNIPYPSVEKKINTMKLALVITQPKIILASENHKNCLVLQTQINVPVLQRL